MNGERCESQLSILQNGERVSRRNGQVLIAPTLFMRIGKFNLKLKLNCLRKSMRWSWCVTETVQFLQSLGSSRVWVLQKFEVSKCLQKFRLIIARNEQNHLTEKSLRMIGKLIGKLHAIDTANFTEFHSGNFRCERFFHKQPLKSVGKIKQENTLKSEKRTPLRCQVLSLTGCRFFGGLKLRKSSQ